MINRKMVMVGLVSISGINGVISRIRRIKGHKRLIESLMVFILMVLLIQMYIGISNAISTGLIKVIPPVCMPTGRKREQVSYLLQLTHLS